MPDLIHKWAEQGPEASSPNEIINDAYILFADDDDDSLGWLEQKTKSLGWTGMYVKTANGIIDAINQSIENKERPFDIIVADVNYFNQIDLPSITGITAAREVRKVRENLPILFISAYVNSIIREEVRRVGAQILCKPVDADTLFTRIARLVYWYRRSAHTNYDGPNRRRNSVNRSGYSRRNTDQRIGVPEVLSNIMQEVVASRKAGAKD